MKLSIKLEKFSDHLKDGQSNMVQLGVTDSTSKFATFEVTSLSNLRDLLGQVNAAKQAIEDYLCEHE